MIRVLAVEDSPTQAAALCADLESTGFTVSLARNGSEALDLLVADEFDVVVSDVVMPEMDGYELCRRVKSSSGTQAIPFVLLTSLSDPLDVVNGLQSGADNFLRKPYQAEQLVARLRTAVGNRDLRRAGQLDEGIQLSFLEREFRITAERQQILDLLISTFEELVVASRELRAREEDLAAAHVHLERELHAVEVERSRLRAVVDAVPVPLFVMATDGVVTHASEASARTFNATTTEICGRTLDDVVQFVDGTGAPIPPTRLPHRVALTEGRGSSEGTAFDVFLTGTGGTGLPVVLQASPVLDDAGAALINLANIHYNRDELAEAEALYTRAIGLEADFFEAHFNLGNIYHDLGRLAESQACYLEALHLNPFYADAHFYLAVTFEKIGQSQEARPHWRAYQQLAPQGEWVALAREFSE